MEWYFWIVIGVGILFLLILLRCWLNGPKSPVSKRLDGKLILITGCTSGIGKETSIDLLNKGARMIFANRDEAKTIEMINSLNEEHRKQVKFEKLDLSSFSSVIDFCRRIVETYGETKIDYFIFNAGSMSKNFRLTEDKIEMTLQSNLLSYMLITSSLLKSLNDGGRIINVGSDSHFQVKIDFDLIENDMKFERLQNNYQFFKIYGQSKLGMIFFVRNMVKFFKFRGINLRNVVLHPGAVFTNILTRFMDGFCLKILYYLFYVFFWFGMKSSWMGAQTTLYLSYCDDNQITDGGYYENCKLSKSSKDSYDEKQQIQYLKYCLNLLEMNEKSRTFIEKLEYFKYLKDQ